MLLHTERKRSMDAATAAAAAAKAAMKVDRKAYREDILSTHVTMVLATPTTPKTQFSIASDSQGVTVPEAAAIVTQSKKLPAALEKQSLALPTWEVHLGLHSNIHRQMIAFNYHHHRCGPWPIYDMSPQRFPEQLFIRYLGPSQHVNPPPPEPLKLYIPSPQVNPNHPSEFSLLSPIDETDKLSVSGSESGNAESTASTTTDVQAIQKGAEFRMDGFQDDPRFDHIHKDFPRYDDVPSYETELDEAIMRVREYNSCYYPVHGHSTCWNTKACFYYADYLCRLAFYKNRTYAMERVINSLVCLMEVWNRIEQGSTTDVCKKMEECKIWAERRDQFSFVFPEPGAQVWKVFRYGLWECESYMRDNWYHNRDDDFAACIHQLSIARQLYDRVLNDRVLKGKSSESFEPLNMLDS